LAGLSASVGGWSSGVDVPGELPGVLGERFSKVSVVPERVGAAELEPCGVPPLCPFLLDVWRLHGFDGPGSEEVLAAGDLGPDEDRGQTK